MVNIKRFLIALSIVILAACSKLNTSKNVEISPPEELYGQLFYDVAMRSDIFEDSKTFVDCTPKYDVAKIRDKYLGLENKADSAVLANFIYEHFNLPVHLSAYTTDSATINEHITKLWNELTRPADPIKSGTLIPLAHPYVVPGGRFREIYYWDSYFTILGLQADGKVQAIQHMVDNFSDLLSKYGHIPNGNRTYYLSRSQPPFYALMVEALAASKGDRILKKYLKYMQMEYDFWMDGAGNVSDTMQAFRRVVRMPDGTVLNRYWDDKDTPRSESYKEDVMTANEAQSKFPERKKEDIFRDLRAGAESGWDFSSRWLSQGSDSVYHLYTIHTTDIIPVDLNCLLYNLEYTLAKAYEQTGDQGKVQMFKERYASRQKAITKYCWSAKVGFFMDYDFKKQSHTSVYSLAGAFPLFFKIADIEQAAAVAKKIQSSFLKAGGVTATLNTTSQQWDAPNGWAPLQWITIVALRNYGNMDLANQVKNNWMSVNQRIYQSSYKMLEKYNVDDLSLKGGGGEYPNQDGFGWTNGVYQRLSKE